MPLATSLGAVLLNSLDRFPHRPAVMIPPEKGEKGFKTLTYKEWGERIRRTAAALKARGIERGDRVAIIAESSPSWAAADWSLLTLGAAVVPIYPTLPADQAMHIVRDSGATLVLASDAKQVAKIEGVPTRLLSELDADALKTDIDDVEWRQGISQIDLADLATLIYTSGTTGVPKGVILPHRALVHFVEAIPRALPIDENDVWFSILPQSHIFERGPGQFLPTSIGACIGWAKNLATIASDMLEVRPTIMLCVPRFLESFRERILDSAEKMSPLRSKLFFSGLGVGHKHAQGKLAPTYPLFDKLVMAKIRERMGGRIRFMVSGGAALPSHVAEFFGAVGLEVLQGYGLTETCGGTICNRPGAENKYWTIGTPIETEAKLAEDGELLLRGDMVFDGYWNLPEETNAAFTEDGWFRTGDIAAWEDGRLKITDRKKDLIILGNGKNVAPQPIENAIKAGDHIGEAVVLGDGMDGLVALIVPNFEKFRHDLSLPKDAPLPEDEVRPILKREIDAATSHLASHEKVKRFAILDTPFTVDDGTLTPSLKVRRKAVAERYREIIDEMR